MIQFAVVAAASFNLVCAGTIEKTTYNGSVAASYNAVYRVDTSALLWCLDDEQGCKTPEKIKDLNAVYIKFIDATTDTPQSYFRYVDQVNRETGRHQVLIQSGRGASLILEKREGVCTPEPFSGFPKAVKKF